MSLSILRSRACRNLPQIQSPNNNVVVVLQRFMCTNNPPPPKPPSPSPTASAAPAASTISSSEPDLNQSPPPPPPSAPTRNPYATAFKFGLAAAITAAAGFAGYATYAYSVEEVDERTKAFRGSANFHADDEASGVNKFLANMRASVMMVPAKAIDLYLDMRRSIEEHVRGFTEPLSDKLLPDLPPGMQHVFTLVLDLNDTLVYSDWKRERGWRTFKRPGVDAFLEHLAQFYEIVVYSDQLNMYVDPVVDKLDEKQRGVVPYRLSRSATRYQDGKHYRDLSKLNRDPTRIIYISGHALENCLQPENCVEIKPWTSDDLNDTTLLDLIPFLEFVARSVPRDIRQVLASYHGQDVAKEFIQRSKEHQRRMQGQKQQGRFWRN